MIDFHSHILPKMDDGSKDVAESLSLLRMLAEQGVTKVVATPHFYANDEPLSKFLARRQASFEALSRAKEEGMPDILLGAEVKYYQGISRLENLRSLCLEGTNLLLLEMSSSRWTEHTADEVVDLSCRGNMQVVLAHVERYLGLQSNRVRDMILGSGLLMQANAEYFTSFATQRKAVRELEDGYIHVIGSDCHGVTHRPPKIGKAMERIRRKLGDDFVDEMVRFQENLFAYEERPSTIIV